MDNLITLDDFKGRYVLQVGQFREEQFNDYIAQKQHELLKRFLGADLYTDFEANETDSKWVSFVDGAIYYSLKFGRNYHFEGFKSILIKFVFAKWVLDSRLMFNETGAFEPQNLNSVKALNYELRQKSNCIYNIAANESMILFDFMYSNGTDYPDFEESFTLLSLVSDIKTLTLC